MADMYHDQPAEPASGQEASTTPPVPEKETRAIEMRPEDKLLPPKEEGASLAEAESAPTAIPVEPAERHGVADATVTKPEQSGAPDQAVTLEHLLARQPQPPLDTESLAVRERLSRLRTDVTTLLTDVRWSACSLEEAARRLVSLLDFSPLPQWASLVVTNLYEIDRAGILIPVWRLLIEKADPQEQNPLQGSNPADTPLGKACRLAVLMLGNYREPELTALLGRLALDPRLSFYAAQALLNQNTLLARQTLVRALKEAEGWARVDLLEACLKLKQPGFFDLLLAVALERIRGLEAYVAPSLYKSALPLEAYLNPPPETTLPLKLVQHAALVCYYVLLESVRSASVQPEQPPVAFERELRALAEALFTSARRYGGWQQVVALHQLALLLGRYWASIARGLVREPRIVKAVSDSLPLMPEIERWMNGPARDILLAALPAQDERAWSPVIKTLLDLRELRLSTPLLEILAQVRRLESAEEAQRLALACEALAALGEGRALETYRRLLQDVIVLQERLALAQRAEPLPPGDKHVPGSILAVAVLRALAQLATREGLDLVVQACRDFDPVVREAALEALMRLDGRGELRISRMAMREALSDQAPAVAALACHLAAQYQDRESLPALRYLLQSGPPVREAAAAALARLEQAVA
ncbi:HEAT repeat domain-containing protein [Thermogemmatispora sp.]|uniref:HEAT repeat domain-containing protein n=1 Tax=Thermogemmatispora sp. TaxID=1968838 RepID=UPI001DEC5B7E|nr:HEAT repeat domain-containing protein [Thermogemmatispora sp.]MBX5450722.1 HEAT repeat domain-containing protein [Thermogemmatispora sp.]